MNTKTFNNKRLSVWKEKSLTYQDYSKVLNLITDDVRKAYIPPSGLHMLYLLAENSKKIDSHNIPKDVVTLNTEFILTTDSFQKQLVRIIFPKDIKDKFDISVFSPIGIACLGAKEKDYVLTSNNALFQKLFIEQIVFQPEREKVLEL